LVQHLVNIGQISADDARNHPQRNVIYRSLGDKPQAEVDIYSQNLLPEDRLLLCSDGLSVMLDDQAIKKIIQEAGSPQDACDQLVQAANQAGGVDNISAIVVEVMSA
jgi:protein phosphatase